MNSLVIWNFQVVKSLPSNFDMCRVVNLSDIFAQSRSVTDYISRKELHDQKKRFIPTAFLCIEFSRDYANMKTFRKPHYDSELITCWINNSWERRAFGN